jgi:hypothetical protein
VFNVASAGKTSGEIADCKHWRAYTILGKTKNVLSCYEYTGVVDEKHPYKSK